ncbi:hypothetical protein BGZ73_008307 [Actinomortierella ambigua]|nr:hypothetical protein BGZ73_008307 [Actinomortierella ambigua]
MEVDHSVASNTAHSHPSTNVLSMVAPQRSASVTTHTSVRATPYSRDNYIRTCSHTKLLGAQVLTESSCSHVECWDRGRHAQNTIHIPIREGAPYQVGDVLDAIHARGYDILRYDVYPWRYAEDIDIIEVVGKPPADSKRNHNINRCCSGSSGAGVASISTSAESADEDDDHNNLHGNDEYSENGHEDGREDEYELDEHDNGVTSAMKEKANSSAADGSRSLCELVAAGIQVLGHPVQVLRPKGRFDQLWRVKIRGWETGGSLSELYHSLQRFLGPNREVVELELMGIKTKRSFWPTGDVTMYVRIIIDDLRPKRIVITGPAGLNISLSLTWLTCLERCPGGPKA